MLGNFPGGDEIFSQEEMLARQASAEILGSEHIVHRSAPHYLKANRDPSRNDAIPDPQLG